MGTSSRRTQASARQVLLAAVAGGCVLLAFGACGGSTTTSPMAPPTPTPTGGHRIQQLKTPLIPPAPVTELGSYRLPSESGSGDYLPGIVQTPDGYVWASELTPNVIARVTPGGTVAEFPVPTASALPSDMTIGPDGNVWFSEMSADKIATIDVRTDQITEYPLDPHTFPVVHGEGPRGIITGPDGNIWFQSPDSSLIAKMSTGGVVLKVYTVPTASSGNTRLTVGADQNIWFTESYANKIGTLNVATGAITEFPVPTASSYPYGLTAANDGNVWFAERDTNQVGSISTNGFITEYTTPTTISRPAYMTTTLDGSVWFPESANSGICRVDPIHLTFVEYQTTQHSSSAFSVLAGIARGIESSTTTWETDEQNAAVVEFGPGSAARRHVITRGSLRPIALPANGSLPEAPVHAK